MTAANTFFVIACAAALSEVAPWIVDVRVVEKILTEDQSEESPSVASENDNEVMYTTNYADDYDYYQTFRQKEVKDIIQNGSVYLEGLSDAIAAYRDVLYNCSRSSSQPGAKDTNGEKITTCVEAEKKKLDVQKLSETALLAADKLRDRAYGDIKQGEGDDESDLIELARSLERLARLTGYDAARIRNRDDTESRTAVDVAVTEDQPVTATAATVSSTEDSEQQQLEILEQVESRLSRLLPTRLTDVKRKRDSDVIQTDVKHKRDTGEVVRYYLKHKVWDGSNPTDHRNERSDRVWNGDHQPEEFDARNSLEVVPIRKRSLDDKKSANMLDVIQNMRRRRCRLRERAKTSVRKLVKSIKVYRTKIFTNKSVNGH